jgi:hypothetical protein
LHKQLQFFSKKFFGKSALVHYPFFFPMKKNACTLKPLPAQHYSGKQGFFSGPEG